jgi:lipopolysaccharide transport system permease protein
MPVSLTTADPSPVVSQPPTVPDPTGELPVTVIDGRTSWSWDDVRELWRFRELFYYLTLRDIKLRYKQTALGVGWSVFQPIATILVFVVFIGVLGKAKGDMNQAEYVLFVIAGVIPWTFFSSAVVNAGNSLVNNERLVTKTYFPRLALPAANVFAAIFDFTICLVLFAVVIGGFQLAGHPVPLTWQLVLAPVLVALLALFATGVGVLLSALIAAQRDFRFLITFGMQLWMFATPCIYLPPENLSSTARNLCQFNPVYGLILNFRACTLGTPLDWLALGVSVIMTAAVFVIGLIYFRRVDRTLADTI